VTTLQKTARKERVAGDVMGRPNPEVVALGVAVVAEEEAQQGLVVIWQLKLPDDGKNKDEDGEGRTTTDAKAGHGRWGEEWQGRRRTHVGDARLSNKAGQTQICAAKPSA
jgi:hypothetical protein